MVTKLQVSYKVDIYTISFNGCSCLYSELLSKSKTKLAQPRHAKILFLILKIYNYFLHLRILLKSSVVLKIGNKMVFEMVLQMAFVPNLCTVKTNMVKTKSNRNLHKYRINWYSII